MLYVFYLQRTGASAAADLAAIARFAICGAVMALFLALGLGLVDSGGQLREVVIAIAGAVAGGAVYAGMANWLGVEELREATSRVAGRFRRGGTVAAEEFVAPL